MANTKIKTIYLTADGRYHIRTAGVPSNLGAIVQNHREHQAHILDEQPTFIEEPRAYAIPVGESEYQDAGRIESWEQVREVRPRNLPSVPDKMLMIVEDQNAFPITTNPIPSVDQRHHSFIRIHEQGIQRAQTDASRADMENRFLGPVAVIAALVTGIAAILIGLIWALGEFGSDPVAPEPAVSWLALLGATLTFPRIWRVKLPRLPRRQARVKQARIAWETLYLFCEITHRVIVLKVPFDLLSANLPVGSRFLPDVLHFRYVGMIVGALAAYLLGFALLVNLIPMEAAAVGSLFIAPLGLLGWYLGPLILKANQPPIWIARRTPYDVQDLADMQMDLLQGNPQAATLDDLLLPQPVITGYTHTHGTGMPMELFDAQVSMIMASEAEDEQPEDTASRVAATLMAPKQPESEYIPALFNAHTLYELLSMRDEKAMFRGGLTGADKLQIGGILALAGIAIVILFLVVASQGGG